MSWPAWGLAPPVVAADAGCGDNAQFRDGLAARGRVYVMQVDGELTAHAGDAVPEIKPYTGRCRRPLPRYRSRPVGLRAHAVAAGRAAAVERTWRNGSGDR